jgi:hypothetical protein
MYSSTKILVILEMFEKTDFFSISSRVSLSDSWLYDHFKLCYAEILHRWRLLDARTQVHHYTNFFFFFQHILFTITILVFKHLCLRYIYYVESRDLACFFTGDEICGHLAGSTQGHRVDNRLSHL